MDDYNDNVFLYFKINKNYKDDFLNNFEKSICKRYEDNLILNLLFNKKYINISIFIKTINNINQSISYKINKLSKNYNLSYDISISIYKKNYGYVPKNIMFYKEDIYLTTNPINSLNFIFNKNNNKEDNNFIIDIFKESNLSDLINKIYIV